MWEMINYIFCDKKKVSFECIKYVDLIFKWEVCVYLKYE